MDDNSAFTYGNEKSATGFVSGILFSHVGMFAIVAAYACLGAQIFVRLESHAEEERYLDKQMKAIAVNQTIDYTVGLLWYYGDQQELNWTYENYNTTVHKNLKDLEKFILDAVENHNYDGTVMGWSYDWTFMNCLLLTMTIMTTIGYGHISPKTFEGQMFCICYAMIGSPLFLVFLANLGNSMANGFTYIYSRFMCRCCRSRRYMSELPENKSKKWMKQVMDDTVGEEEFMPTNSLFVPITINLVVLHAYIVVGGVLFRSWEGWDLAASYYFTFITLSTIGYGDYVPGNAIADGADSVKGIVKMLVAVLYIVLGMAMLSMCINLMQEQIVDKCRWLANEVGLSKSSDEVEEAKPIDKRKDSMLPIMEGYDGPSPFRKNLDDLDKKKKKKDKKKDKKEKKEKKAKKKAEKKEEEDACDALPGNLEDV